MEKDTFGKWLRNEIMNRNMTQADLARSTGITTAHIANLVNEKRGISAKTCAKIAKAFHLTTIDVMESAGLPVEKPEYSLAVQEIALIMNELSGENQLQILKIVRTFLKDEPFKATRQPAHASDTQQPDLYH